MGSPVLFRQFALCALLVHWHCLHRLLQR